MRRRDFLLSSTAAFFGSLVGDPLLREAVALAAANGDPWILISGGPEPLPEITAAVDVLVPADPEVPGDFKGSDYNGDRVVAAMLTDMGQTVVVARLNQYAKESADKTFMECDEAERLEAIKAWVRKRDDLVGFDKEMLTGLLTMAVIGTYENNPEAERDVLFESMGWYDPKDRSGTFRLPNEGYVDVHMFPAALKKGVR